MPLKIAIFRGSIKYFFNASAAEKIQGNEEVKKLLSYISTNVPDSAFTQEIEEEVEASSNDAEWRKGLMTFEMLMEEKFEDGMEKGIAQGREEGIAKGMEKGIEQGAYNKSLETAKKLLQKGMALTEISDVTGLQIEKITELEK